MTYETHVICDICGKESTGRAEDMMHLSCSTFDSPYIQFDICEGCIGDRGGFLQYMLEKARSESTDIAGGMR